MKRFPVQFPASHIEAYLIGKVIHAKGEGINRKYSIAMLKKGRIKKVILLQRGCQQTTNNAYVFEEDPHLNINDVIELTNDSCYVHFSYASNDCCLVVNNECNENCINCPQCSRVPNPLQTDRNKLLLRFLPKSIQSIALSGGEPTLYIDSLCSIIAALYKKNPNICIDILTNGITLADEKNVARLVNVLKINTNFCITLYGDTPTIHDKHTRTIGSFSQVNRALHHLALHACSIELRFLITRLNYERLPSFIEYVYANFPFVDHIALMGMEVSGEAQRQADVLYIEPQQYEEHLKDAVQKALYRSIPVYIYNHQVCQLPKELWKFTVPSISDWKAGYQLECRQCDLRGYCGGFFLTSDPNHINAKVMPINLDYSDEVIYETH